MTEHDKTLGKMGRDDARLSLMLEWAARTEPYNLGTRDSYTDGFGDGCLWAAAKLVEIGRLCRVDADRLLEICDFGATAIPDTSTTPDPLHARARVAIAKAGLDGTRLETAVGVFGWGSPEANGSLLALARDAWDWIVYVESLPEGEGFRVVCPDIDAGQIAGDMYCGDLYYHGETEAEALVACIEAKA